MGSLLVGHLLQRRPVEVRQFKPAVTSSSPTTRSTQHRSSGASPSNSRPSSTKKGWQRRGRRQQFQRGPPAAASCSLASCSCAPFARFWRTPSDKGWVAIELRRQPQAQARGSSLVQVTATTLTCRTNAECEVRAACSSGLHFRSRFPSPMEYVRDEAG